MNTRHLLFGLLCLAQLATAASGIARHERVLSSGTVYRFETAPVDPLDLFRGRYVRLAFTAADVPLPMPPQADASRETRVYAVLGVDARGFAKVSALQLERPEQGDYIRVEAHSQELDGRSHTRITLPFERYFMEESSAPEAERRYRDSQGGNEPAYAIVRVLDGVPVLESLVLPDP